MLYLAFFFVVYSTYVFYSRKKLYAALRAVYKKLKMEISCINLYYIREGGATVSSFEMPIFPPSLSKSKKECQNQDRHSKKTTEN